MSNERSAGDAFARVIWVLALLGLTGFGCGRGTRPAQTGSNVVGTGEITDLAGIEHQHPPAKECGACHSAHYAEWAKSFHAQSFGTEGFRNLFRRFSTAMEGQGRRGRDVPMTCFGCHAPLLAAARDTVVQEVTRRVLAGEVQGLEGLEVDCAACHEHKSGSFSGPIKDPVDNPVHGSVYASSFASAQACQRCHSWTPPAVPCATVYNDWEHSQAAREGHTCQSCHMAERDGAAALSGPPRAVHAHTFGGGRSAEMLQRTVAVALDAAFVGDQLTANISVRNLAAHRVPDGCPWTTVVVLEVTASDETGWEFGTERRVYTNIGLTEDGRDTVVLWEIARVSPRATALEPEEVRRETVTFPVRRSEARVVTVRARMLYRLAPAPGSFGAEGPSIQMADVQVQLPGERAPRGPRPRR